MSQGDICRAIDMDRGYMSAIENGKKNITLFQLERLAKALSVGANELLRQSMKLKQVINLKDWQQRNISVGYGTRDKTVLKRTKKGKVYFLAKTYDKDLGELRSEVCASALGRLFGFPVQKTWLCRIPQYKILKLRHSIGVLIQLDVRRQRDTRRNQFREDLLHGASIISLIDKKFSALKNEKERRKVINLSSKILKKEICFSKQKCTLTTIHFAGDATRLCFITLRTRGLQR